MKKTIISIAAAALCACAISAQAFAADIMTDRSIYAKNLHSISQSIKSWEYDGKKISPDLNTAIPVYEADLFDYAKTGNFEVKPLMIRDKDNNPTGNREYIADAVDENRNFVGIMELELGGNDPQISLFRSSEKNKGVESVAFDNDAVRINALAKKSNYNTNCNEIKLVWVNWLGYVYYIDNGSEKMLAATHLGDVNGNIFNSENGGLIVIDDGFKAKAEDELRAYNEYLEEWQKILDTIDPNTPLPSGGYETPTFKVDNTPYLDTVENRPTPENSEMSLTTDESESPAIIDVTNTPPVQADDNETKPEGVNPALVGGIALAGGIALTTCVIGVTAAKKKKK